MKYLILSLLLTVFSGQVLAETSSLPAHDSSLPVEITADQLEIVQQDKQAVFSGDVEATQGDLKLKADKMMVFYRVRSDLGRFAKSANSVSRVETSGHVQLSTPRESARGDNGVFNVDEGVITLTGNVELKSGKNLVKGEKLVYNLKTGRSSLGSGAEKSSGGTGKKERVHGVFIPNEQ